jgi:fermentation-respiration switch protein FrsA (DUF1100 family)
MHLKVKHPAGESLENVESSGAKKWIYLKRLILWIALVGGLIFMLRLFEHSQVYHPSRGMEASGADLGRPWEDVFFTSEDGVRLNGWFFPGEETRGADGLVFLLCHGNGGNISHRLELYEALLETGCSVFAFDYRGYGLSQGRPSEHGTYKDAAAALNWLVQRGFKAHQIILLGESLGGGVASDLATREAFAGLILLNSFTSLPDIGSEVFPWLPVRLLCSIHYNTHSRLKTLRMPILIMHSRNDGLIGYHHAETNFAAAREPKLFWELRGTHNDPLIDPAHFIKGIRAFLAKAELSPAANPASARR